MTRKPNPTDWHPTTWQKLQATQQPLYPDSAAVEHVVSELSKLPPIVTSGEILALKSQIAAAQLGEAFLLQGGDCAESFAECTSDAIAKKLKILLQMSVVLLYGLKKPIIRVGRMAGQYAKPRSADTETRGDETLPSYRGDLVNRHPFTAEDRIPDPQLMLRGYERAALTLNFVRALVDGGFADLHHPENWDLDFVHHSPTADRYQRIVHNISESLDLIEVVTGQAAYGAQRVDFYSSHEGLHLPYEQAQTRWLEKRNGWFNLATHFPWVGMRTAAIDDAHVEYYRGIENPIAIKLGPAMSAEWLQELLAVLNPRAEPGRMTLICRFGADKIEQSLPPLIQAVRATGSPVLWSCDPMHGNTESTASGVKTRRFDNILSEVKQAFRIHRDMGSHLGGVHFELTGDDVTECTGGARGLTDADLQRAYRSTVDPRLNYEQALELALNIADAENGSIGGV
ncbi:MAG: 3-deoxy-7-phosphoheptulonate synthase class II [Gammaproteobacteria bacterium]|nr:3-deoxy-7-phosphoheptulonate synthase class II [Gammaproteobacteria bacterium]